ncbi:helix-turn-helix domain-containing protein [Peptoniphilus sp.]|uniref:helix-turn-helix domain-containing protein n=1 Tax=Peptoniphilus sp. TaxID=1971214 RepID=UPI00399379BE
MLDILKLKGKVAENNLNMTSLSKKIGMNKNTLYRKIANNGETLNLGDIKSICNVLDLNFEDACKIFMNM